MKLKFKQVSEKEIQIIAQNGKEEKVVGNIFTPSSSGHNLNNAIQICGFTEAFDLWGCSEFQIRNFNSLGFGNSGFQQAKDIQLQFAWETRKTPNDSSNDYRSKILNGCCSCFNNPCTCEVKTKHDNPFTVKREQDLFFYKDDKVKEEEEVLKKGCGKHLEGWTPSKMNFEEIRKELLAGKKVKRSCWETGHYWEIKNSQITNSKGENPSINVPQLQVEDWELYKEEKDFCLSDKREMWAGDFYYEAEDVKEFIKELKDTLGNTCLSRDDEDDSTIRRILNSIINRLSGDELK